MELMETIVIILEKSRVNKTKVILAELYLPFSSQYSLWLTNLDRYYKSIFSWIGFQFIKWFYRLMIIWNGHVVGEIPFYFNFYFIIQECFVCKLKFEH